MNSVVGLAYSLSVDKFPKNAQIEKLKYLNFLHLFRGFKVFGHGLVKTEIVCHLKFVAACAVLRTYISCVMNLSLSAECKRYLNLYS